MTPIGRNITRIDSGLPVAKIDQPPAIGFGFDLFEQMDDGREHQGRRTPGESGRRG